jgi:hypothetical protein
MQSIDKVKCIDDSKKIEKSQQIDAGQIIDASQNKKPKSMQKICDSKLSNDT